MYLCPVFVNTGFLLVPLLTGLAHTFKGAGRIAFFSKRDWLDMRLRHMSFFSAFVIFQFSCENRLTI